MAKGVKKGSTRRTGRAAAKPPAVKKKTAVKKTVKKSSTPAAGGRGAHHAAFRTLAARSNRHAKAPVCYQQLSGGSWMICFLKSDGEYAQCQRYDGPVHEPLCG